jgi:pyrroline-5-carboxylate reductase
MFMNKAIAFIGGGNMATALIGSLLYAGWPAARIAVFDPDATQRERLETKFGVRTFGAPSAFLRDATAVVWAVKPQVMREAVAAVAPFTGGALHISIAAGVRTPDLAAWLGSTRVVRAVPNLPALVRAGVTAIFARQGLSQEDRDLATRIFDAAGPVFWVTSEDRMNAFIAVSGSGPGFVFHFLEGFQQAAEAMGFERRFARELVLLVTQGAVQLAREDAAELRELKDRVSSKGGTTAAGTRQLDEAHTHEAMVAAVRAAFARAGELGSIPGGGGAPHLSLHA